jgi:conjugal transfer ATP-binding protein TraC
MVIDLKDDMKMLQPVVAKMAAPFQELDPVQYKALGVAIMRNFREYGREMTVTALRDTFKSGRLDLDDVDPKLLNEDPRLSATLAGLSRADVDQRIVDLATLLSDWSRGGQYEDFVDGHHTVNFENDFVYVETEGLQGDKALATVAQLIVVYRITQEMYFSGLERRKVFLVDEVRKMLGGFSEQDLAMLHMVTDLYLRVRKYNGAMGSATQSMAHYLETAAARSIYDGADFKIWLFHQQDAIELLASKRELDMNEGMKFALKSMETTSPHYKDCYIKSTLGSGPARIFMDPFTRLLFSNRAEDNVPIDQRVAAGMTYVEAIDDLIAARQAGGGVQ